MISWLEISAVLVAVIGIILTIIENRSCWLANILASVLYLKVFNDSNLPGQALLQLLYIVVGFFGYIHWHESNQVKIKRLEDPVFSAMVLASVLLGFLFHKMIPGLLWADSAITVGGIFATYLTTRKFVENWMLWGIVNIVSVALFTYQALYLTAVLYLVYTALSLVGLKKWSKELSLLPLAGKIPQETSVT